MSGNLSHENLRSQSLDLLRFPLAVVILLIHVFSTDGITFQGRTLTFESYPLFLFVNRLIDGFLRGQSVPIYYFISGFVFFIGGKMTKDVYIRKFKNRTKSLLIPYLIWNVFAILLLLITIYSSFNKYKGHVAEFTPSFGGFLSAFWMYHGELEGVYFADKFFPINAPLWFVRNLMVVVICTPLINFFLKRLKHYLVIILGVVWFLANIFSIRLYSFGEAFFFFVWGAYMSMYKHDILTIWRKYFKVSTLAYIILGGLYVYVVYYIPELKTLVKQLNILAGLIFAYNLSAWLLKNNICRINKFLSSASFFIYVSHFLIAGKVLKLIYVCVTPTSSISLLIVYISATLTTLGILLFAFYLLRRYTPEFLKIIAGRK